MFDLISICYLILLLRRMPNPGMPSAAGACAGGRRSGQRWGTGSINSSACLPRKILRYLYYLLIFYSFLVCCPCPSQRKRWTLMVASGTLVLQSTPETGGCHALLCGATRLAFWGLAGCVFKKKSKYYYNVVIEHPTSTMGKYLNNIILRPL